MVGHVIGLGDRHGSNILVDQLTWTALHIDFGDVSHLVIIHALAPWLATDRSAVLYRSGKIVSAGESTLPADQDDDECYGGELSSLCDRRIS